MGVGVEGSGFASATDGAVTVDSNTGTTDDLQQELASEVATQDEVGRRTSKPAEAATLTVDDDDAGEAAVRPERRSTEPAKAGKRQSLQARIDAITGEKYATARERDAAVVERDKLRAELAALRSGGKPAEKPAEAEKPAAAAAETGKVGGVDVNAAKFPKYAEWLQAGNDGELEDWIEARDAWKAEGAARVAKVEAQRQEQSKNFTQAAHTFNERMKPILEADPEFYERIDPRITDTPAMSALPPGMKPNLGNFIVEQIMRSPHPKELMEHLSDPKVIQRVLTLQPGDIIREINTFELTHGGATVRGSGPAARATDDDDDGDEADDRAAAAPSTSRAQPPAKPVRGSSHEHVSPDDEPGEDASDDDWYRWENRRKQKAARA